MNKENKYKLNNEEIEYLICCVESDIIDIEDKKDKRILLNKYKNIQKKLKRL